MGYWEGLIAPWMPGAEVASEGRAPKIQGNGHGAVVQARAMLRKACSRGSIMAN